jgi:formimidoylglutamate deiminase
MRRDSIIEADLTWTGETFEPNVQVAVSASGLIEQVGFLDLQPTLRLEGRALLPGLVNASSIGFQRGLRGFYARSAGPEHADAWTSAVRELVALLSEEAFGNLLQMAFAEMLYHGITTVGEFHVLRHGSETPDYTFDEVALSAAKSAGIRIVLLCGYASKQVAPPGTPEGLVSPNLEVYFRQIERLRSRVDGVLQRVGLGIPNLQYVSKQEVRQLADYAVTHHLPLHVAVDRTVDGRSGCSVDDFLALAAEHGIGGLLTVVNARGCAGADLEVVSKGASRLCVRPLTEAMHGRAVPDVDVFRGGEGQLCVGTGCNVRISMTEEVRFLEYSERTRRSPNNPGRPRENAAPALWRAATTNGAAALGVTVGKLTAGQYADFFAVDTGGLSLLGATADSLLSAYLFGADRACITNICVGGQWRNWDR